MSSLIVASDLDLMMLEVSIEQLVVPRSNEFDKALLKKTVAMFRLLDKDWTTIYPQRSDYQVYRGSNSENEPFNGGVSVLFPIPESSLHKEMDKIDLQLHVRRELSKYFELRSSEVLGIACIDVSGLFNGIIRDLRKVESDLNRAPISHSSKDTYALVSEDGTQSGAEVTVYLRLTHLGNSLISEIEVPDDPKIRFYAKEETSDCLPYQLKEINVDDLTGGCWGSDSLIPPRDPRDTICCCCDDSKNAGSKITNGNKNSRTSDSNGGGRDDGGGRGSGGGKTSNGDNSGDKKGSKHGKGDENGSGSGGSGETGDGNDDQGTVSCLIKPALCGREGTCRKKDKKGKFGKCGKPDGEGGNPLACGERRKCALRRSAAGSATVGIVDKKVPCPPRPIVCRCPAPVRQCPTPGWPVPCPTSLPAPCSRYQSVNYYGSNNRQHNLCENYDTRRYMYPVSAGCGSIHFG